MNTQKGFTLVEGLLIVLILCVVGFVGYTVWGNSQDDENKQTEIAQYNNDSGVPDSDEIGNPNDDKDPSSTESWTQFTDARGDFSMKLPDGWRVVTHTKEPESSGFYSTDYLEDETQTAEIDEIDYGGRGGPFLFSAGLRGLDRWWEDFYQSDPTWQNKYNLNAERLTREITETGIDGVEGDISFIYVFDLEDGEIFTFTYLSKPNQKDSLADIESALATLSIPAE